MLQVTWHSFCNIIRKSTVIVKEDSTSTILACIPLHGDQLFEERARNVKWTFRDGLDPVERIDGIDTEFVDWHAKYTLYKVKCW